ncbi:MAG: HlyD family type I secretion periplasmic adaptor subunit [Desulforhopalus sp.]
MPEQKPQAEQEKPEITGSENQLGISMPSNYSPWKIIIIGFLVIFFFSGLTSVWLSIVPLHGAALAPGVVVVNSKRKTVQHLEGGIIREIMVREGELVVEGQPLIVLDSDQTRATVAMYEFQIFAKTAVIARLRAEKDGLPAIQFPASLTEKVELPEVAEVMETEIKLFNARLDAFNSQIELFHNQIKQVNEEKKGNIQQLSSIKKEIAAISEQLSANRELLAEGYVTKTVVLELERLHAEKTGLQSQLSASIAHGKQRELEFQLKIISLKSERIQETTNELKNSIEKRFELRDRLKIPKDILDRQIIRAPITGKVVDLKVTTVGGTIAGQDSLMDIVPVDDSLIVEAKVGVDDISEIQLDQTTEITFTAYKASTTPTIKGKVTYIAADRLLSRAPLGETPYYLVYVTPDAHSLKAAGNMSLYPGMAAHVSIQTKARTALDYFLSPLKLRIRKTFNEQ